jgi:hypothetical protein
LPLPDISTLTIIGGVAQPYSFLPGEAPQRVAAGPFIFWFWRWSGVSQAEVTFPARTRNVHAEGSACIGVAFLVFGVGCGVRRQSAGDRSV